ncbi:hypothetical protein BU17DRAFT_101823 [Hysterangium stoloniferum]|nr:hypothetical protein BU17DRAFT_101823 [Hysterangium stoloniferum]
MALNWIRKTFSCGDEPLNPNTIKALREQFICQSTMSIFVAAVQATTLGNSFLLRNTPTTLLVVTNAFLFTGIIYNVSAGFLSLVAATALIGEEQQTTLYHEVLTRSTSIQLGKALKPYFDYEAQPSIARWLYREAQYIRIVKATHDSAATTHDSTATTYDSATTIPLVFAPQTTNEMPPADLDDEKKADKAWEDVKLNPANFFRAAEILGNRMSIWLTVGAVAGLCTVISITSFFVSIICFTIDTQSRGVWITTVAVLAPVVIFLGFYLLEVRGQCRGKQRMLRTPIGET